MFSPHIMVACVAEAEGKLLVVEERINGVVTWNQPAGHLEASETLVAAPARELYEETGIRAQPDYFLGVHQWVAPDNAPFIRFLFSVSLSECGVPAPQDPELDRACWVTPEQILIANHLRSPLVAESVRLWQQGVKYPFSILHWYGSTE